MILIRLPRCVNATVTSWPRAVKPTNRPYPLYAGEIAALLGISEGAAVALQLCREATRDQKDAIKMGRYAISRRSAMKNTECTIYITTKHGWTQSYRRDKNGWTQTGPNGVVRPMTAEQLLSHILPPLAAGNPDRLSVRVEPDGIEKERHAH